MLKTTFIVIRHGQTDWNLENRLMGVSDIPLNTEGKRQAASLARNLKGYPLGVIVSSPLKRAVQTSEAIRTYHPMAHYRTMDILHERNFGTLEGTSFTEANHAYPQIVLGRMWQYPDFRPPGGESLTDVSVRARSALHTLNSRYEGSTIAVVSHGSFIRNFLSEFLSVPLEQINAYGFENTSISIVRRSGGVPEAHIMNLRLSG